MYYIIVSFAYPGMPITKALTQNTLILYWAVLNQDDSFTIDLFCVLLVWALRMCTDAEIVTDF